MYALADDYRENPVHYFVDDVGQRRGIVYQPDVYTLAELVAELAGAHGLIDVGCGYADKLEAIHRRHPDWELLGVDYGHNIEHCRRTHRWGAWMEHDLETGLDVLASNRVIVCSDVVEHLADPTRLLKSLKTAAAPAVVISTPERDVMYGQPHSGPPANLCHVREWNMAEFRKLLASAGLNVRWHGLSRSSDQDNWCATQVAVCQ